MAPATLLAAVLAAGGCATVSSVEHPASLIGASVDDVERAWGKPYFAYRDPDGGAQPPDDESCHPGCSTRNRARQPLFTQIPSRL